MFEEGGEYANRKGKYTVLSIESNKMQVRYEDGTYAELNIGIQSRIWQNIVAEQEAIASRSSSSAQNRQTNTNYYIKSINIPDLDELIFPGWQERVVMANNPIQAQRIRVGDRLIFYGIEIDAFFAVATITGEMFKANPKDYFFTVSAKEMYFFPLDIDTTSFHPNIAVKRESVELENYRDFTENLAKPENFFSISEDDFELLAELLTELNEEEGNGIDDEDYEEEDEE